MNTVPFANLFVLAHTTYQLQNKNRILFSICLMEIGSISRVVIQNWQVSDIKMTVLILFCNYLIALFFTAGWLILYFKNNNTN